MSSHSLDVYMPVLILMGLGVIVFAGALLMGKLIRPHNPNKLKEQPYECGEDPIGQAWSNFHVRFYVVALIFIIFDVEGALMIPVAAIFKKFNDIGAGGVVLGSLLVFMLVLLLGVVYCWKKGDLDWIKSYHLANKAYAANDKKDAA